MAKPDLSAVFVSGFESLLKKMKMNVYNELEEKTASLKAQVCREIDEKANSMKISAFAAIDLGGIHFMDLFKEELARQQEEKMENKPVELHIKEEPDCEAVIVNDSTFPQMYNTSGLSNEHRQTTGGTANGPPDVYQQVKEEDHGTVDVSIQELLTFDELDDESNCNCEDCLKEQTPTPEEDNSPVPPIILELPCKRRRINESYSPSGPSSPMIRPVQDYHQQQRSSGNSNKKQYPCTLCPKVFYRTDHFAAHLRIHEDKYPFHCTWTGCQERTRKLCNLKKHIRMHHFHLPETLKLQRQLNIVDTRDPMEFVRILQEQL